MTLRVARVALDNWSDLDGYAAAHGMPELTDLGLDRFCNFVWYMMASNKEEQDRKQMRARLWRPPPGETEIPENSPWSAKNENAGLAALKQQAG